MSQRQGGPRRRVRACICASVAVLASVAAQAAPAQAVPAKFWGVDPQQTPSPEQFQQLQQGGVDSVRFPIEWGSVEPVQGGPLNWGYVDAYVKGITDAGLEVLPFIAGAPEWAVRRVSVNEESGSFAPLSLPVRTGAQRVAWQAFLRQVVLRYGPNGSFWAENPAVPYRPIRVWQIWNEENFKYFVARPNPVEYGKLVNASYTAIKSVDSGAKLILGGMFAEPKEGEHRYKKMKPRVAYFATEFLEQMYAATPGIKNKFQGIALHPYTINYPRLKPEIENVRQVLKEAGDPGKGIWITEMGWSSEAPEPADRFAKGLQGQAKQLEGAFKLLEQNQVRWRIKRVFWFSVDDEPGVCNFCDGSGLFSPGFVPKPAWSAYVRFAGGTTG